MKQLLQEVKWFLEKAPYVAAAVLTAVCSYGFAVVQPIIGIDDTAVELYLADGLEVVMGRWTVFLLNKLFHVSEFAPFMLELVGVLFMFLGATVFCVLLKRIFGEKIGIFGYTIFTCVFLSNPIISEVFIYYYHDGVGLGYLLTALSLLAFSTALDRKGKKRRNAFWQSLLFIWIAVGCYESLLILYILGVITVIFLRGLAQRDKMNTAHVVTNLGMGALLTVGSMVLRSAMIALVTAVFGLQDMVGLMEQRSLTEMLVLFQGREGLENFFMLAKRFWLVYHVNAVVYLPVTGYVLTNLCVGMAAVILAVKRKNLWYPVLFGGMLITPFLLTVAEARVTHYRSCQYLPFVTALGILLLFQALDRTKFRRYWRYAVGVSAAVLVFNQASYMNESFYIDYKKYENAKETMNRVAGEIEKKYGSDIPVVFTGHYDTPQVLVENYYVSYTSWQYRLIARITDMVDVHLKEKYFSPHGYSFIGEANYPLILWGLDAFDGTNRELIKFLEMHGHSFSTITDKAVLETAREIGETMPRWPKEGSVAEQQGYILVHF